MSFLKFFSSSATDSASLFSSRRRRPCFSSGGGTGVCSTLASTVGACHWTAVKAVVSKRLMGLGVSSTSRSEAQLYSGSGVCSVPNVEESEEVEEVVEVAEVVVECDDTELLSDAGSEVEEVPMESE